MISTCKLLKYVFYFKEECALSKSTKAKNNKNNYRVKAIGTNKMVNANIQAQRVKQGESFESIKKCAGRPSYVFKAMEQGLYERIRDCIRSYMLDNPGASYMSLYKEVLHTKFPTVFNEEPEFYKEKTGNLSKLIQGDPEWSLAYNLTNKEMLARTEVTLYKKINDTTKTSDVIKAYDVLKKYQQAERELDVIQHSLADTSISLNITPVDFGGDSNEH